MPELARQATASDASAVIASTRHEGAAVASHCQQTIGKPATVTGFGYWSGSDVRVEFRPAAPQTGIIFVRGDLSPAVQIPATLGYRIETPRRTTLTSGGATVEMVEHILAALSGLGIDNCEVHVNASEMPGCDGSSLPFVEALDGAGLVSQDAPAPELVVREVIRIGDDEQWVEARPANRPGLKLRYRLHYPQTPAIGRQTAEFCITPDVFRQELAPSRTFMLKEEADWMLAQGFGTRVKHSDVLVFDEDGPIENEQRFADECVRHKTLDLLGDLALVGCRLVGHVVGHRSGHRLNAELVRALLQENQITPARPAAA